MACRWITTSPPTQLILWQPSRRSVHAIAASVRGSVSSPLSLSVEMSPFWQNAHRILQEVKKIVPEPSVPRKNSSSPVWWKYELTREAEASLQAPNLAPAIRSTRQFHGQKLQWASMR